MAPLIGLAAWGDHVWGRTCGTAIFMNDLITAVLLFNQFAILRSRALLAIASGYLFAGLMVIRGC